MENVNCNELNLGHRYGLWGYESNNEVSRVCDKCGYVEILPVTSEVLEEIKNQIKTSEQRKQDNEIASRLINAFATLSINDSNLIGYLNVVLRDSFDYLGDSQNKMIKEILLVKLEEIKNNSNLTVENTEFLAKFIVSINESNIKDFYDVYEDFYKHNEDLINNFQTALGHGK